MASKSTEFYASAPHATGILKRYKRTDPSCLPDG